MEEEVKFCRICLNTRGKLLHENQFNLQVLYEQLFDAAIYYPNIKNYYCHECFIYLWKFNVFRRKCLKAQNVLESLIQSGPITHSSITSIDRKVLDLESCLKLVPTLVISMKEDIHTLNNTEQNRKNKRNEINAKERSSNIDPVVINIESDDEDDSNNQNINSSAQTSREVKTKDTQVSILNVNRSQHNLESSFEELLPSHTVATYDLNEGCEGIFVDNIQIPVKEEPDEDRYETFNDSLDDFNLKPFTESDDEPLSSEKPLSNINDSEINISKIKTRKNEVGQKSKSANFKQKKTEKRKSNQKSLRNKRLNHINDESDNKDITAKLKVKYATQREKAYKFSEEKWKIVHLSEEEVLKEYRKRMDTLSYQNSVFRCDSCVKNFTCEDTLRRHMRVHDVAKGKHKCFLCKRRFKWEGKLRTHVKTHQIRYHCLRCPEVCNSSPSAIMHEKTHEGHKYQCKYCEATFVKITSFYTHVREKHRSSHVCAACGESFVSSAGLVQHMQYKHREKLAPQKPSDSEGTDTKTDTQTHIYCERCDISFESTVAFEEHKKNSTMHAEQNDTPETNSEETPKLYKPGMCPKAGENDQFTCEKCSEVFSSHMTLRMHSGRVHGRRGPQQRYICEICGAALAPKSITLHMRNHLSEKQRAFPCGSCEKVFKSAQNRAIHVRRHTGQPKPYVCKLCDKRFTQRHNMQVHQKSCLKRSKKTQDKKTDGGS
ncbi:hypothetical protein JYU34_015483 [Plutella xylostella]|uniref:Uncharacterized protein n=1 Tax=Plutella xylostella TaxID=51655 RepID=A0ABQ7Q770_PLUXY|nr:hypothetical protein JYU34_015483 [Plutella xylostella]